MTLDSAIDNVLPQSSVLFKDSGLWAYYKSDDDFINGNEFLNQECSENFGQFVNRIIETLIKEESDNEDPEPLVSIDFMIYNSRK